MTLLTLKNIYFFKSQDADKLQEIVDYLKKSRD